MNERTQTLITNYAPELAIVVYKSQNNRDEYYLESHTIAADGKLLEGKPLKQETISAMVDVFFDSEKGKAQYEGLFPENLLSFSHLPGGFYEMSWYQPEQIRNIYFESGLHIPSGKAWIPPMMYKVNRRELYVFAMKESIRPTEKAKFFRAPFHNIYDDGRVCLGDAKVKKPANTYAALVQYWDDLFWLSKFSHLNGGKNPTKTNINMLWKKLVESKTKLKWSELDELLPIKVSLNQLV